MRLTRRASKGSKWLIARICKNFNLYFQLRIVVCLTTTGLHHDRHVDVHLFARIVVSVAIAVAVVIVAVGRTHSFRSLLFILAGKIL